MTTPVLCSYSANYKHGAYLIIEHTEALHVVDVNSGNRTREKGQEANALDVNLGAADALARQLRLRDMGGIIVVCLLYTSPAAASNLGSTLKLKRPAIRALGIFLAVWL